MTGPGSRSGTLRCSRILFREHFNARLEVVDKAGLCTGRMVPGCRPDWRPLLSVVGDEVASEFMWMFEVRLASDVLLQAYKHIDTRHYLHLDPSGVTYLYEPPDRYRRIPSATAACVRARESTSGEFLQCADFSPWWGERPGQRLSVDYAECSVSWLCQKSTGPAPNLPCSRSPSRPVIALAV